MEWAGALRLRGVGKEGKKGCRKRPKSSAIIDAGVVNGGMINVWSEGGREGGSACCPAGALRGCLSRYYFCIRSSVGHCLLMINHVHSTISVRIVQLYA